MRKITDDEVRHYEEHGVVYLPELLDEWWLKDMEAAFAEEMFSDPLELNHLDLVSAAQFFEQQGLELLARDSTEVSGRFWVRTFNWRRFPSVAALGCGAPLPEAVAKLIGAMRLDFHGEQLFFKEAGSLHRTAFHQDAPYFHLNGEQCCTVWMPLDVVDSDNSMMGYVRTVHGSTGNTSKRDRRSFTLRYVGDDVRYVEREGVPPDSQKSDALERGDLMDSDEFPLVWTADRGYVSV